MTEAQVEKWRLLSDSAAIGKRVKKFFLYVPEGREENAQRPLEDNGIEYDGLRTWAVRDGRLVITPITTHDTDEDHR